MKPKNAKRPDIKTEDLVFAYVEKKQGVENIGRVFGITATAVWLRLKKAGVPLRPGYTKINTPEIRWKKLMINRAKLSAERKGIPFNLELSDITLPERCPILGLKLRLGGPRGDNSPSLDRLIPTEGYTKRNTWVISMRANRIKSDGTPWEFKRIAEAVELKLKENLQWPLKQNADADLEK
jgi:hypothetical protein